MATQEATGVRKYVMEANSLLTDSSNLGREKLQPLLQRSNRGPGQIDEEAMGQVVEQSEHLYQQAQENSEVPPEFEEANNYLVSTLGVRATATRQLQRTLSDDAGGSGGAISAAVEDYRTSDNLAQQHYFSASENALKRAGQQEDRNYLEEPRAFINYRDLSLDEAGATPNALHGVEIAEREVPVKVVSDTQAGRQANSERIRDIQPSAEASVVETGGFRPGESDETAEVVEAGPVEYEELTDNNILNGWLTFGL